MIVCVMKWIADAMLGDLARYLVILGEDAAYWRDCSNQALIDKALIENRIVITRNRNLEHTDVCVVVCFKQETSVWDKLEYLKNNFSLVFSPEKLFTRCLLCNVAVTPFLPGQRPYDIPERIFNTFQLYNCPVCGKIFWRGGHVLRTEAMLKSHGLL